MRERLSSRMFFERFPKDKNGMRGGILPKDWNEQIEMRLRTLMIASVDPESV